MRKVGGIAPCARGCARRVRNTHDAKVLVSQSKLRTNKVYVWSGRGPKVGWEAEIRSCHESKWRSTSTLKILIRPSRSPPELFVLIPFVMRASTPLEVPLAAFVRALDLDADDVRELLLDPSEPDDVNEAIRAAVLDHADFAMSRDDVLAWLGEEGTRERTPAKRLKSVTHLLLNEVLPHCGMTGARTVLRKKGAFAGMAVRRLVRVALGHDPCDDRDHNKNKRLDGPGPLLAVLFRQLFRNHLKSVRASLGRYIENGKAVELVDHLNFRRITSQLNYHFATGVWSTTSKTVNTGVVQVLSRMSSQSALSHLRRMSVPINRDGKSTQPRMLHPSEYGIFCPAESPEGASCGLIHNLALLTHVCLGSPPETLVPVLRELGVRESDGAAPVFINGDVVGRTEDADALVEALRALRRAGDVSWELSVSATRSGVFCYVDAGRCTRPLFVLSALDRLPAIVDATYVETELWPRLMSEGVVEFLDKQEEDDCATVAVCPEDVRRKPTGYYTHVEIDKLSFLSPTVASIPFSDHNQAPRNMYQAAMGKQAISVPSLTFGQRMSDTHMYVNTTAAKPLVDTYVGRMDDTLTCGTECVVAIMSYTGFSQEDSTIWCKSAIERGLGGCVYYRTYRDELASRGTSEDEAFGRPVESGPNATSGLRAGANYAKLDADGLVPVGCRVEAGDVIIGKVATCHDECSDAPSTRDRSTVVGRHGDGIVDRVLLTTNRDGKRMVTVRVAQIRRPEIGDKFSSRHGQKGTIGLILQQEDMPFTRDGISPDLIINPNCVPSRMTIAQLLESVLGKACAIRGQFGDGTPFRGTSAEHIADALEAEGFRRDGKEVMYSGITGEPCEAAVFTGLTYYQRLKHMVVDKIHSRARGPKSILVRQPLEGRSRCGGLRLGEMERDALLAHSGASVLQERLCVSSDATVVPICRRCGSIAIPATSERFGHVVESRPTCKRCQSTDVGHVMLPYACKLLSQELEAMHVGMRFATRKKMA